MHTHTNAPHGRKGDARPHAASNLATPANPMLPLAELAAFFIGFRMEHAQKATTDKVCLITPHDLTDGILNPSLPQGVISNLPPQQVLQAGDVLLAALDGGYLPVVLPAPAAPCVACAPLWVIRIHDPARLLPPYLAWYLQTRMAQKMLCCVAGQGEPDECTEEGLHTLRVVLPDAARQAQIVNMAQACKASETQAQVLWQEMVRNNEDYLLAMATTSGAVE